jgi:murein DD-endopeptidase MepM/ murein hydrolase activator NlpD
MRKFWPVPQSYSKNVPKNGKDGSFRRNDYYDKLKVWHTGTDLFCPNGSRVIATEDCTVVRVWKFTGPPDASQYRTTWAVNARLDDGRIVVYGEVRRPNFRAGKKILAGQTVGYVAQVEHGRKQPLKGYRNMLHFELYKKGTRKTIDWWHKGEPKPVNLLDPTKYLEGCKKV